MQKLQLLRKRLFLRETQKLLEETQAAFFCLVKLKNLKELRVLIPKD